MPETLKIVARIQAAPGAADGLAVAMKRLVEDTRKEPGCLRYDLHRGTEHPDVFVFVEEWQSKRLWEDHMNGEAINAFNGRIGSGQIANGEILQLSQIA